MTEFSFLGELILYGCKCIMATIQIYLKNLKNGCYHQCLLLLRAFHTKDNNYMITIKF